MHERLSAAVATRIRAAHGVPWRHASSLADEIGSVVSLQADGEFCSRRGHSSPFSCAACRVPPYAGLPVTVAGRWASAQFPPAHGRVAHAGAGSIKWGTSVQFRPEPRRRRGGRLPLLLAFLLLIGVSGVLIRGLSSSGPARAPTPQRVSSGPPTVPAQVQTASGTFLQPSTKRLVLTYFYYWYDLPGGVHSMELTDHPIDPNASYKRVSWFTQQLSAMQDAGIDIALASYWGPIEPSSDIGLANMAKAREMLVQQGKQPPSIAMYIDTGAIGQMPLSERDLTNPANQQLVYGMIHKFYTILPRSQWALINGRPVIWLWAAYFDITFDQSFFSYVNSHFSADFGVTPYIVGESSWRYAMKPVNGGAQMDTTDPMPLQAFYEWGASLRGFHDAHGGVAEVGPGYDERLLTGADRQHRYTPRNQGQFYTKNLRAAVASGEPLLAIETWDEFHEATDIADSREYGRKYIQITRHYADLFHAGQTGH